MKAYMVRSKRTGKYVKFAGKACRTQTGLWTHIPKKYAIWMNKMGPKGTIKSNKIEHVAEIVEFELKELS